MQTGKYILATVAMLMTSAALAVPVYQPPSANLTYGDVTHGQRAQSAAGNPAAAAADLARNDKGVTGSVISVGGGIEYGNVQDLFDVIDELALIFAPSPPGDGGDTPGQDPDDKPDDGIDIGDIVDGLDPDFKELVKSVANEVAVRSVLLALISVEGYAKAFVSADAPIMIGSELLGGAWTFGLNWSGTSKSFGVSQEIDFDAEQVLKDLEAMYDLIPGDSPRTFDVKGDLLLTIDPTTGKVKISLENDSLLLSKAAKTIEFGFGYGRQAWATSHGQLYLGAEAKYYLLDLSRLAVRFGDITDSDELFESIRDADFQRDDGFGLDLGALWVSQNYQVGATLTNINEPSFEYPTIDNSRFKNIEINQFLKADQRYEMERQLKLESSIFTSNRRWTLNLGIDANAVPDPMNDDYQWLTISGGYATESWWLPGARVGFRRNLAGTELSYLGVGVTAFKIFNIDVATALDTVRISGTKLPRGLMISIGFDISF